MSKALMTFAVSMCFWGVTACVGLLSSAAIASDQEAVSDRETTQVGTSQLATDMPWAEVENILNNRCVVCHSCYDAPCQLKLTSPMGVLRGASKEVVYDTKRLTDAPTTRLGIDAQTVPGWRALGFYSVAHGSNQPANTPSLLEKYLELGHQNPLPPNQPLPDELGLAIDRSLACPKPDEFDAFADGHRLAGMPYAAAPLSDTEYETLLAWARQGVTAEASHALPDDVAQQIADWENFLNDQDLRSQLMSRYLYEHLFLARLHFPGDDPRRFFEIVRSRTPSGEEVDVIATRRPFNDPGDAPFYYRLRLVSEAIVHKEHLVYAFGPDRLARFKQLFLAPTWSLSELPPYGTAEGGNPFTTFAAMPARSRYQFMLDDALFFVRSFIRGPVCHGQTAVDVIEDRFWVSFLDPDADLSITDPTYLIEGADYLELPVSLADEGNLTAWQGLSHQNQARYLEYRDARYRTSPLRVTGFDYNAIWDGDGTNPNALITVFRHFDNASAQTGFHGDIPETAWVIDYPIFERIYYNLVAGYDVYGRVAHQLGTRVYMDELRMESEDTFLTFMPRDVRQPMHASWYRGILARIHTYWHRRRAEDGIPTGIAFETETPKQEFLLALLERGDGLWPITDELNRCTVQNCLDQKGKDITVSLRELASQPGNWVKFLPDLSILAIEKQNGSTEFFTLVHDKAHKNIAFLFDEAARREPEADVLTIIPGFIGSYPNFFYQIEEDGIGAFVEGMKTIRSQDDYMQFADTYGIRRTSPYFWGMSDRLAAAFRDQDPVQAGIFDLNRYKDPKLTDDPT